MTDQPTPDAPPVASRTVVEQAIGDVAPDADLAGLDPAADLRDALELDSMDFLNIVVAVSQATGIDVPERDYPQLLTLAGFVHYVERNRDGR